ncbi:type VI secretion system protein TssA [Candidatus Manganitrophus noduliformans]|uniref:Type VI secretion system protein TssA n=1 Tax=Candidatus Manganitrophus noduliformans TaxID=2606439 RepID=A0A7X6DS50_9BACT|nr:type VI secretion system protein TssA [Candidatus Manganitrophus noduliformans]NKE72392.1 type VI secretion system protein TssA [Candidatus Manganitrophus noduliformans]
MSDEIAEWVGIGSTPIRSDAPSGDSAKYDPLFEKLQAEIGKLEALSGGPVQWKEVVGSGREILEKKSKDLLVASYVSVGLLEQRGYAGLLAGLSCMEGMVEAFWETLYPETKRMRARINALIWLSEKGGVAVGRKKPVPGEGKEVRACSEKIDALEKYFGEKLANDSPGLGDLRRAVDQWAREVESAEAATARTESPAPSASTSPESAGPAISSGKIESIEEAERAFGEAGDVIRRAADVVRGQQPTNPWPYQIMRALTWSRFDGLPAHTDWETRIPAPPSHLVESGRLLVEQRGWKDLVDQVEAQLPENPFWLDLQRLSALALSNLGSSYAGIKSAVLGEVRILLQRLPDLPRCRFADGTPFADDETQQWIEKEVLSGGNGASNGAGEGSAADARIAETRAQANQLLGQGEAKGAVALFQERINGAASRRERFLLQLALAQLCLDAGHPKVALSQLDALQREIDRFSLEEWEPALSLEVLRASWRVLNRLSRDSDPGSPEWAVRAEAIYGRISRLDPVSALELDRK